MIEHMRAYGYMVFRLRYACLTLVRPLSRPCDTCFGFMLLVFCIFDKPVHAAITMCTLLDTMRVHLIVRPIFPYVSPQPSRLVTCTYSTEFFRCAVFLQNRAN